MLSKRRRQGIISHGLSVEVEAQVKGQLSGHWNFRYGVKGSPISMILSEPESANKNKNHELRICNHTELVILFKL
jgi:hypothetical protein